MGRKILLAPVYPAEPARVGEAVVWEKPPHGFLKRAGTPPPPGCSGAPFIRRLLGANTHWLPRPENIGRQSLEAGKGAEGAGYASEHLLGCSPGGPGRSGCGGLAAGRRGSSHLGPSTILPEPAGRAARAAEGRRGRAEGRGRGRGRGRGLRLSREWSAASRLWLGRVAGVTAALAMRTLWMVLCALARLWPGALAGCAEAGRCCPGRDPACFARGWRLDRVYGTCFCDQACRLTGDCCFDYDRACPGGWLAGPGVGPPTVQPQTSGRGQGAGLLEVGRESSGCF